MFIGSIITGLILIFCGLIVRNNPDLIAGYNAMSSLEKENINIEELTHITRKYLIFTGATVIDCGIICYIFNVPAKIQGYCIIGIIIIGILLLAIRSKQFENHN